MKHEEQLTGTMEVMSFSFEEDETTEDVIETQDEEVIDDVEPQVEDEEVEQEQSMDSEQEELEDIGLEEEQYDGEYSAYDSLKDRFIKDGTWQNAVLEIDGEEVELKDLKDITPELFDEIHEEQRKLVEEDTKEKFISKEDFSEMHLNVINLMKTGVDTKTIQEALKYKEQVIDPLESYDLDNVSHQEQLVAHVLRENNKGVSKQAIQYEVELLKKENRLSTVARDYSNKIKDGYNQALQKKTQQIAEEQAKIRTSHSELTDKVLSQLKERKVKNTISKTIDNFYRSDVDNTAVINEINKIKENPDKLARLLLFLTDEEEYNAVYNVDPKIQEGSKVLTRLSLAPSSVTKKSGARRPDRSSKTEELAERLGLNLK